MGSIVPWAESGVGAVATQSFVEVSYGPLGLNLLKAGKSAQEALTALVTVDKNEAVRQVAMVDAQGELADKLLAALEAAQQEGGDIRGKQSAALIVVSGNSSGVWWQVGQFPKDKKLMQTILAVAPKK